MRLYKEGIELPKEATEIFGRLGSAMGHAHCLNYLACLLFEVEQLDAAEEVGSLVITLFLVQGNQHQVCQSHRILGEIYRSKGEREMAIYHFEAALGIASSFSWNDGLLFTHHALARLAFDQGKFDDADAHVERAKTRAVGNAYFLGREMELQSWLLVSTTLI